MTRWGWETRPEEGAERTPARGSRALTILGLAAATLVLLAACGGQEPAPSEPGASLPATSKAAETRKEPSAGHPDSLTVALDWFPNPDHVGLFYALDHGYFGEQALDVELKTPSDPSAGLKLVATGKFDLAVYYEGDMFFAGERNLPVIAVGSLVPNPLNSLIALASSRVKGPETIAGATIGVAGLPFDDAILKTMREQQGLPEGSVTKVNVGFNLVPALLTKKVDAVIGAYWNIEGAEIELETGTRPTIVQLDRLGVPHYDELVVVANSDRLASDATYADAVRRFLAAAVRGTTDAQTDEAGSVEIMQKDTEYTPEQLAVMVPKTLGALAPPDGRPVGCFDLDAWRTFGGWMLENELLRAPVDAGAVATNDYLPGC